MEEIYFTPLTPELLCSDVKRSLSFYVDVLGFNIQYDRPETGFAMLEKNGARLMLDQYRPNNPRKWIAAPLEKPYGRGINFEIDEKNVEELSQKIIKSGYDLFLPVEERWYRADNILLGCRQFIVLDPDGYMLRFSEDLGEKLASEL